MTIQTILEETFAANFVAYYRAHVAHVNVTGRNFTSDHKLLGKIYEDLQTNIDMLAELLRTIGAFMPNSLAVVQGVTTLPDLPVAGDSTGLLSQVRNDLEILRDIHKDLAEQADAAGDIDISNYAQDRVGSLSKFIWQLDSTLGNSLVSDTGLDSVSQLFV